MSGVTIQIPQLNIVLPLSTVLNNQTVFNNLSTIQTLKGIINANNVFTTAVRDAGLRAGINYTLTNNQTNTLITQDNATLSDLGINVGGSQWPKITLKILNGGGRKSSTRRRRRSSKRRIRRKKRTKRRRSSRRRSKKRRTRIRRKTK